MVLQVVSLFTQWW